MEGTYSAALGQNLAKCCWVVCGDHYPVQHSICPLAMLWDLRTSSCSRSSASAYNHDSSLSYSERYKN